MIHSGSRNLGATIAEYYHRKALYYCDKVLGQSLPDENLAYIGVEGGRSVLAKHYIRDMKFAMYYAKENRCRLMESVLKCIQDELHLDTIKHQTADILKKQIQNCSTDVHHNYADLEEHFGKSVWVHRKGAVSARKGEMVVIPGSMGTSSYIGVGKGNPDSFMSCSHGAGRKYGRNDASRKLDPIKCKNDMSGIVWGGYSTNKKGSLKGKLNLGEAPEAYKNIDAVMDSQKDLVNVQIKLRPILSVKGD